MILYFSGTGNSAHVARRLGRRIEDEVVDLFERLRNRDYSKIYSDKPMIFVYPTYAWRMPRILESWIKNTVFAGNKVAYFVTTCGSNKGDTDKYLSKLCEEKGFIYRGSAEVVMPENYIAMFPVPDEETSIRIVKVAERKIKRIAGMINRGEKLVDRKTKASEKLLSSVANDGFYKVAVNAKKFYATDACISCGKCERVCPLNNIAIVKDKPVWGKECTHCMACICKCPREAIEYGKASRGKRRYTCPRIEKGSV